jgi:uncharacterized membrane protein YkvA (DUF1232 family)
MGPWRSHPSAIDPAPPGPIPEEMPMSAANTAAGSAAQDAVTAEVLQEGFVKEGVLAKLLRRAGRTIARPALECYEMLVDGATPHQARLTVLAALTYLMVPLDLIPDFLPAAGFSDDMVALTALLGLCSRHITPAIRTRAKDRLERWFPLSR